MLQELWKRHGYDLSNSFAELSKECQDALLFGTGDEIEFKYKSKNGNHKGVFRNKFEGIIGNLERRYHQTNSAHVREWIESFMRVIECPECGGARLKTRSQISKNRRLRDS